MTRTRTVLASLATLSALALGACSGDDPEPKFAPTPTVSPTSPAPTSSSPTEPVEPTMPAQAEARSHEGAEAFVRYWVAMVNFAQSTGEISSLKSLNESACSGCQGLVKAIESAYSNGGRIEGGDWSISALRQLPLDYGAEWAAFSTAKTKPQTVVSDQQTQHFDGGSFDLYAYVDWNDGWRMRWLRTPTPS